MRKYLEYCLIEKLEIEESIINEENLDKDDIEIDAGNETTSDFLKHLDDYLLEVELKENKYVLTGNVLKYDLTESNYLLKKLDEFEDEINSIPFKVKYLSVPGKTYVHPEYGTEYLTNPIYNTEILYPNIDIYKNANTVLNFANKLMIDEKNVEILELEEEKIIEKNENDIEIEMEII